MRLGNQQSAALHPVHNGLDFRPGHVRGLRQDEHSQRGQTVLRNAARGHVFEGDAVPVEQAAVAFHALPVIVQTPHAPLVNLVGGRKIDACRRGDGNGPHHVPHMRGESRLEFSRRVRTACLAPQPIKQPPGAGLGAQRLGVQFPEQEAASPLPQLGQAVHPHLVQRQNRPPGGSGRHRLHADVRAVDHPAARRRREFGHGHRAAADRTRDNVARLRQIEIVAARDRIEAGVPAGH